KKWILQISVFLNALLSTAETNVLYISPTLKQIFSGDLIFLSCDNSTRGSGVKWYFDGMKQTQTSENVKIRVAAPEHSGSCQCERNEEKSDGSSFNVLVPHSPSRQASQWCRQEVLLSCSLTMKMVCRDGTERKDPETIFWCTDTQQRRNNQITVRTSEKFVSLEMYPLPAVVGESLTLNCLAWGANQISHTIFYKENYVILEGQSYTYKMTNVTESAKGRYKCDVTFTYKEHAAGPPYQQVSDNQDVFVQGTAVLSANVGMSCSCPLCPSSSTYRWYYKNNGPPWALIDASQGSMIPKASGTYACRAVWETGRSFLSNGRFCEFLLLYTTPWKWRGQPEVSKDARPGKDKD
uniref:Ig-like domain-containing protein n=1 Tax=Cyclopterus lumpus TaxID=8103 RepID=A0A8C2X7P1_CYCLU